MFDPATIDSALRAAYDTELARVEEAGLNAAQPREQLLIDGWLLRFSPGKARRARSVQAIDAGRLPLDEKVAECRRWYERFRLPLLFRVTPFSRPAALDAHLAAAGFVAYDETRVMTCALQAVPLPGGTMPLHEVDVPTFAAAVGRLRGSALPQVEAHERRLHDSPLLAATVRLCASGAGGLPVAAGQVVVQGDLAGLYDIVTAPAERGRGYGRAISSRLLAAAGGLGARTAYLQVDAANVAARRVYAGLGFADRYAYWYRRAADVVDEIFQ